MSEARGSKTVLAEPRDPALGKRGVAAGDFEPPAQRYADTGALGRGGMGEVRACRDAHLGRVVAMKLLLDEHAPDRAVLARFLSEVRIQAQLEHPSIVPVYDMGIRDGVPFLTMKRVRGTTLAEILERRSAPRTESSGSLARAADRHGRRRLLTAFGSVCQAVDYAHSRGIVHRDLKPANIMLGDFGEVYVLDWGVAKIMAEAEPIWTDERPSKTEATAAGSIVGTPGYMAPEQRRGDVDAIDARTDVYALGAILFEIITGAAWDERAETPVFALDLRAICEKATADKPEDRFASAGEMYTAIDAVLSGEEDIDRRRALSREHGAAAAKACADGDRERAMGEIGRALALDPQNVEAMRVLVHVMSDPPRDVPPEVRDDLERSVHGRIHDLVPFAAVSYASFFLLTPIALFMGVHDWFVALLCGAAIAATAITALLARRVTSIGKKALYPSFAASTLAITIAGAAFGPFILVPALAAMNTLFYVIQIGRERSLAMIAAGCVPVTLPPLLQALDVLPPAYRFDGAMHVMPWMLALRAPAAPIFLAVSSVGLVVLGSIVALRIRDSLERAELRVQLQAWQLGKLLPRRSD